MRFQEFSKFTIRPHLFENKQQYKQIMDTMVNADIISQEKANEKLKEVRTLLKRADRIIWWLRWFRIKRTGEVIDAKIQELGNKWEFVQSGRDAGPDAPQSEEEMKQQVQQLENFFQKITKKDFDFYLNNAAVIYPDFQGAFNVLALGNHWSTMFEQSPQVNQVEWEANLSPTELLRRLSQAEEEWKQKQREEIEPEPDDQIIIDYGKYAWVKLDREYCDAEGKAMGHCGNTGSPQAGDRILSFRTKVGDKKQKPHLTFILDKNGYLGEMKGRGNDKPSEKYHPYIVDLLQKDFVEGIKAGGYLPENNFSLDDLDEEQRKALIAEKPTLGGLTTIFETQGISDSFMDMFESQLDSSGLDYEDIIKDTTDPMIVVDTFDDLSEIVDSFSVDQTVVNLIDIVDNDAENSSESINGMVESSLGDSGYARELYDEFDVSTREKIRDFARQESDNDIDSFEDMLEESPSVRLAFKEAIYTGIMMGTSGKAQEELADWLETSGFVQFGNSDEYSLVVSIPSLMDLMIALDITNISEIYSWGDILYTVNNIDEPTIERRDVYAYDEDEARSQLEYNVQELFDKMENKSR